MNARQSSVAAAMAAALALLGVGTGAGAASLDVTQDVDTAAGWAAFGPASTQFDWAKLFDPGTTWNAGALGTGNSGSLGLGFSSGAFVEPGAGSSINVANWIDGNGFDPHGFGFNAATGAAGPDLALNGAESFTLQFAGPVKTVGFVVATGLSNLPGEVDHAGAVFQVGTDSGALGSLTLVDTGNGYSAWVTIASDTPFTALTIVEPAGAISDQYFGNVYAAVPEPASVSMMLLGIAAMGGALRRRRIGA